MASSFPFAWDHKIYNLKKGDKVKVIENEPIMGVTRRHVGIVISQDKYKLINGGRGWDVEVKFRHKIGTCIFQGEELRVIKK